MTKLTIEQRLELLEQERWQVEGALSAATVLAVAAAREIPADRIDAALEDALAAIKVRVRPAALKKAKEMIEAQLGG